MERPWHTWTRNIPSGHRKWPGQTDGEANTEKKWNQTKPCLWGLDQQPDSARTRVRLLRNSPGRGSGPPALGTRDHLRPRPHEPQESPSAPSQMPVPACSGFGVPALTILVPELRGCLKAGRQRCRLRAQGLRVGQ